MTEPSDPPVPGVIKDTMRQPLSKRFYKQVTAEPRDGAFAVLLDGRPVRTPKKAFLQVATLPLAEAMAVEWAAQEAEINPARMPLTRLVNTAIDGVTSCELQVAAEIVQYAGTDLLCYRAAGPTALVDRQAKAWDPVIAWAEHWIGGRFILTEGVLHVTQPHATLEKFAAKVAGRNAFQLVALHVMTTLTGSALLALAHAEGFLTVDAAWAAAHIDEDYQIEKWGTDFEAEHRRAVRWRDMEAASRLLAMLRAN
jgi:chaperone required for assembly of F1-ATPase